MIHLIKKHSCPFDPSADGEKSTGSNSFDQGISQSSLFRDDKRIVWVKKGLITFITIVMFTVSLLIPNSSQAQKKLEMTGFLEYLNNTWIPQGEIYNTIGMTDWQNQSSIYNRFNVWWTPTENLVFYAGMRNNFTYGPLVANYNDLFSKLGMDYNELVTYDNGYLDLTFTIADGKSYILYTNFDRLSMQWTLNKFELTVGRQRINWGVNMIWNPNDIFNAYNYFDFNYIERPGSDALKMEFYTSDFSSVQIAGKLSYVQSLNNSNQIVEELKITTAAMYKFNKWNYDFQVFGGYMLTDFTAGLGWAGDIAGAGFTGEVSWFHDEENFADTSGIVVASIAVNYTFKNSIFINFSGIYNSAGETGPANAGIGGFLGSASSIFATNLNAKNLTRSRFDIFGQISYPVTPLINLSLASIYNPFDKSVFVGPSVTFSLTDNISLLLNGQLFWGDNLTEFGDIGQMVFLDLKWSF